MTDTAYAWLPRITMSGSDDDSGRVIVSCESGPFIRTSSQVADVLRLAQGAFPSVDPNEIASTLGASRESIETVLASVGASPALTRASVPSRRALEFRRPLSLQLTLFDPSALLTRVPFVSAVVRSRAWWVSQVGLAVIGALVLIGVAITPDSPLHRPMTAAQYVGVFVALFLAVFVHEFAHAATLVAFGGRSHRLGVMLFYLAPAFFCDVSDAWRLRPERRVQVALAGITAQGAVAAVAALVALFLPPDVAVGWDVFAVLCLVYALFNLVPFVKLDGYIALVGHFDRPNLRAQALQAFRSGAGRTLLGTRAGDTTGQNDDGRRPSVELILFGAACWLLPIVLVAGAGLAVNAYLASWGAFGAWITLAVFTVIGLLGAVLLVRAARRALTRPPSRTRSAAAIVVGGIVVAGLIGWLPLPQQVTGGVTTRGDSRVLVLAGTTSTIPVGTDLTVYRSAVFPSRPLTRATVTGTDQPCSVPLEAVAPMTGTRLTADAHCFATDAPRDLPENTLAVVTTRGVPLAQQLTYLFGRAAG